MVSDEVKERQGGSSQGGSLIGQGTYGCVLSPPPSCSRSKKDRIETIVDARQTRQTRQRGQAKHPGEGVAVQGVSSDMIGKVFSKPEEGRVEWRNAAIVAAIDPHMDYFIYPQQLCYSTVKDIMAITDADRCNGLYKSAQGTGTRPGKGDKRLTTRMLNGGDPIYKVIMKRLGKNQPMTFREFIHIMLPVFHGVVKLGQIGYLHHDLKSNNIVYDEKWGSCRIIDLGLMLPLANVLDPQENYLISRNYWLHPPEYRVIMELEKLGSNIDRERMILLVNQENSLLDFTFSSIDPKRMNRLYGELFFFCDLLDSLSTFKDACIKNKNNMEFWSKNLKKIDVYSLGLVLMHASQYLRSEGNVGDGSEGKQYMQLVRGMLFPDPRKRLSALQALKKAKAFIAHVPQPHPLKA